MRLANDRPRLLVFVGACALALGLGLGSRSVSATPAEPITEQATRDAATQLEADGEYEAAAEQWAALARSTLDPMALLYADSAWTRAFAADGNTSHLCAGLGLSAELLAEPTLDEAVRAEILEIRESQLAAIPAELSCRRSVSTVPLFLEPPPSSPGDDSSTDVKSNTSGDNANPQGDRGHRSLVGGRVTLAVGSVLGMTSVVSGAIALQAIVDLKSVRDQHLAEGTQPSLNEREIKEAVYRRGQTAELLAITTGAAAVVTLAVGAGLLIRGRRIRKRETAVAPLIGPRSAGIALGGRF